MLEPSPVEISDVAAFSSWRIIVLGLSNRPFILSELRFQRLEPQMSNAAREWSCAD
jgi:hypothetical protein